MEKRQNDLKINVLKFPELKKLSENGMDLLEVLESIGETRLKAMKYIEESNVRLGGELWIKNE